MSTLLYASLVGRPMGMRRDAPEANTPIVTPKASKAKLALRVAALIPVEIIALHTLLVTFATTTTAAGATTIEKPLMLGVSLPVLAITASLVYVIGRAGGTWEKKDVWRALIPLLAVVAWAGFIRPSALTPWVPTGKVWSIVVAVGAALLAWGILWMNERLNPS